MIKGERYRIYNQDIKGNKIYEGVATLLNFNKLCHAHTEYWDVKFADENRIVTRWIDPNNLHEDLKND